MASTWDFLWASSESPRFPLKSFFKGDIRPSTGFIRPHFERILGFREFLWAPNTGPSLLERALDYGPLF